MRRNRLASLTLDLMDDGTATRDTFAIVDELDRSAPASRRPALDLSLVWAGAAGQLRPSIDVLADGAAAIVSPDMLKLAVQRRWR
jgi:hypothetical protein